MIISKKLWERVLAFTDQKKPAFAGIREFASSCSFGCMGACEGTCKYDCTGGCNSTCTRDCASGSGNSSGW